MQIISKPGKQARFFVALSFLPLLIILSGCTFGSQGGMGNGLSQQGIYCFRGAVKFTPTPASIAVGSSDEPISQVSDQECKNLANEFGTSWKFFKPEDPQSVIFWTKWDVYQSVLSLDDVNFCILKVFIPSNIVLEKGLGEWQAEFTLGNWSVTCPVREVTYCAEDDHQAHELTIFNATQHVDTCELGVEGIFEESTVIPFPE
jgi:hypothetical protein